MAKGAYSKLCLKSRGKSLIEPVIIRANIKSKVVENSQSSSASSIIKRTFGGIL